MSVEFVGAEAGYNNLFGLESPSPPQTIFYCKSAPSGPVALGTFGKGELIFRLTNPDDETFFTGPGVRDPGDVIPGNPDGVLHARLDAISDIVARIHWEDQWGGGDEDFDDCVADVLIEGIP